MLFLSKKLSLSLLVLALLTPSLGFADNYLQKADDWFNNKLNNYETAYDLADKTGIVSVVGLGMYFGAKKLIPYTRYQNTANIISKLGGIIGLTSWLAFMAIETENLSTFGQF